MSATIIRDGIIYSRRATRSARNARNSSIPCPVLAETSITFIPGRTDSMLASAAARSKPTTSAMSILVMTAMSAVLKMVGYFSG